MSIYVQCSYNAPLLGPLQTLLVVGSPPNKTENNFFMIQPCYCSSSLVTIFQFNPPGLPTMKYILADKFTSILHKSLVQMSRDVYYKGLDLVHVRNVRALGIDGAHVFVCVVIGLDAGPKSVFTVCWAAHHWGSLFPGEQCSYSH